LGNDSGTLIFTQSQTIDQGWYQCNATNIWGKINTLVRSFHFLTFPFKDTALSRKVRVYFAELGAFPVRDKAQVIQVPRGDSLKIPCNPPPGLPNPEIYWTDNTTTDNQFGSPVLNPRIRQDYDGLFYFFYKRNYYFLEYIKQISIFFSYSKDHHSKPTTQNQC
jgi:hypothetical protein